MTTAATSLLGLALPVTGELSGTWGDTVNNSITSLLDTAVAGTTTLSTDADVTLTTTTLAANQARQAILLCSGARTALRTITAPAQSKIYTIINATTGGFSVKLVGVGPTTGLTIPNGASAVVAWNGSDFIEIGSSTVGNLTVNGNLSVTGTTSLTGVATLTANPVLSAGTANGVAYLNGSKVVTTGSALTFNASTLAIATAANDQLTWTGGRTGYLYADSAGIGIGDTALLSGNNTYYNKTSNYIANYISGSEQMRLTSTGLGIGTSSPATKLDVNGDVTQRNGSGVIIGTITNNSGWYDFQASANVNGAQISTNAASSIRFLPNNTERMRLDSSGNLGLGVTPSAWSSSYTAFQTPNGGAFWSSKTGSPTVVTSANAYFDGSSYRYLATYAATLAIQSGGQHQWYNAPSGTAGNTITFTQAMTLDASGNLGIGLSSLGYGTNARLTLYRPSMPELVFADDLTPSASAAPRIAGGTAYMTFSTNGTERARIDSSGNLLVGKTSSNLTSVGYEFDVNYGSVSGNSVGYIGTSQSSNSATPFIIYSTGAGANRFYIGAGGTVYATSTTITGISDQRLKENIRDLDEGLDVVMALKPRKFDWKEGKGANIKNARGFIAQEFETVLPDMIEEWLDPSPEGEEPYKAVNANLIPTLVKAIQEQQTLITQLTARITALEAK